MIGLMNLFLSWKEYCVKRKRIVENIKKNTHKCAQRPHTKIDD